MSCFEGVEVGFWHALEEASEEVIAVAVFIVGILKGLYKV